MRSHLLKARTKLLLLALMFTCVLGLSFYFATLVQTNPAVQQFISQFGYFGIMTLAVISGLNALIPIPAATFVPVFEAAGLWLPLIVFALAVGTTIADTLGYLFGHYSKSVISEKYPKTHAYVERITNSRKRWLLPLVFLYAAIIPFPNELIVIPIALSGVRFQLIVIPLILGNLINQGALAYGVSNLFTLLI